jgi:hypothetical protein
MKCPACEYDVPSDRSACTRCGAPLPPAGERPAPEPRFATGPMKSPVEPPNPRTEPLPVPLWDADEERPWGTPPAWQDTPGPVPMPPEWHSGSAQSPAEPGSFAPNFGAPAAHPRPLEYDPAAQSPAGPAPGDVPAGHHPVGWGPATPGTDPVPAGRDSATQIFGPPGTGPVPPPGYDPAGWDQAIPPVAEDTAAPRAAGRTGGSRRIPLLVGGVVAVVVLGGGLIYALTQGHPRAEDGSHAGGTPGTGTAAQQATAVNRILASGRTARGHLPARLRTCNDVSKGVPGFQRVVRDRQQELSQSRGLKVDRLPDGSSLRRSMIAAYQSSLDADQAYLAWAREIRARGCGGRIAPLTAHYRDAIAANDKAGPAKRQVAALWKPIASSHGLPTYVWNRL